MIADDLNPGRSPVAGRLSNVRRHHLAPTVARVQRQIAAHHPKADDTHLHYHNFRSVRSRLQVSRPLYDGAAGAIVTSVA